MPKAYRVPKAPKNDVQNAEQQGSHSLTSPARFTVRGSEGVGPDLQIQNYTDIGKISVRACNYLYAPAGKWKLCSYSALFEREGDRAQHFPTFGKY